MYLHFAKILETDELVASYLANDMNREWQNMHLFYLKNIIVTIPKYINFIV